MASPGFDFHYAARSDIGLKRSSNQDSAYAGPNLLALADGMGGAAGGDIASSVAIAHLAPLDFEAHNAENLLPLLHAAFQDAHDELGRYAAQNPELAGLGTTCIAILRAGNKLAMAHIGDSRAYLLRNESLTQITTDHSFVQFLISQGEITPEEAHEHPQRNAVTKVLGYDEKLVEPDETIREAVIGDRWLLCSDGLSGLVSDDTIQEILSEISDPGECAEVLISLALRAGGTDNITCVVTDIVPAGSIEPSPPQVVGAASQEGFSPSRLGSSPAAKAAQLSGQMPGADSGMLAGDAAAIAHPSTSARWRTSLLSLAVFATLIIGGWLGYAWTQSQFYISGANGTITIYQGIPQSFGPWELSTPIEVTTLKLEDLPEAERQRLKDPVVRSSRSEIDAYIAQLQTSAQRHAADNALKRATANSPQSGDAAQSTNAPQSGDASQSASKPAQGGGAGPQSGGR